MEIRFAVLFIRSVLISIVHVQYNYFKITLMQATCKQSYIRKSSNGFVLLIVFGFESE